MATKAAVNAFADFDPLAPAAASHSAWPLGPQQSQPPTLPAANTIPATAATLPSRTRSQRRRARKKGVQAVPPVPELTHPVAVAPWEEDPELVAAEQQEANRAAIRKALRAKQQQRSSKFALSQAREEAATEIGTGTLLPTALSEGFDAKTLQALLKKTGHATADAPSMRRLKRAMQNMPAGYLAALGAGK